MNQPRIQFLDDLLKRVHTARQTAIDHFLATESTPFVELCDAFENLIKALQRNEL